MKGDGGYSARSKPIRVLQASVFWQQEVSIIRAMSDVLAIEDLRASQFEHAKTRVTPRISLASVIRFFVESYGGIYVQEE